jgi:hypothetical protein
LFWKLNNKMSRRESTVARQGCFSSSVVDVLGCRKFKNVKIDTLLCMDFEQGIMFLQLRYSFLVVNFIKTAFLDDYTVA